MPFVETWYWRSPADEDEVEVEVEGFEEWPEVGAMARPVVGESPGSYLSFRLSSISQICLAVQLGYEMVLIVG